MWMQHFLRFERPAWNPPLELGLEFCWRIARSFRLSPRWTTWSSVHSIVIIAERSLAGSTTTRTRRQVLSSSSLQFTCATSCKAACIPEMCLLLSTTAILVRNNILRITAPLIARSLIGTNKWKNVICSDYGICQESALGNAKTEVQ